MHLNPMPGFPSHTRVSVPPAVKLAPASANLDDLESPPVASHPLRVACYNPNNRHERKESKRFKSYSYEELTKRDKLNLDIFWLKDESLEDSANLPDPDVIAAEIVEDLEAALQQFAAIAQDLKK